MSDDTYPPNTQVLLSEMDDLIDTSESQSHNTSTEISTQQLMKRINEVLDYDTKHSSNVERNSQKESVADKVVSSDDQGEMSEPLVGVSGVVRDDKTVGVFEETSSEAVPPLSSQMDSSIGKTPASQRTDPLKGVSQTSSDITLSGKVDPSKLMVHSEEESIDLGDSIQMSFEDDTSAVMATQPFSLPVSQEQVPPAQEKESSSRQTPLPESDSSVVIQPSQGFRSNMFLPRVMRNAKGSGNRERRKGSASESDSNKLGTCSEDEDNQESLPPTKRVRVESDENGKEQADRVVPLDSTDLMVADSKEDDMESQDVYSELRFDQTPYQITGAWEEFEQAESNFLRGCKWSPDGSCVLTNSNDNYLRLFNMPDTGSQDALAEMKSVLKMRECELIYDFCWYPMMSSTDPASCCLVSTSRETPIHMWDAFTGELRCSYRAYNQVDEVTAAHSLAFSLDGTKLYSGFNKMVRVFDTARPGRDFQKRPTYAKQGQGQSGIISCIAVSPSEHGLYAAGSYSRSIALYHEPKGDMACMFQGQQGGVTHIMFSPDGQKLYCGGRKDPELVCWDLRKPGNILFVAMRQVETNQRIYFDLDSTGRYLFSGNHDGSVSVWDTLQPPQTLLPNSEPLLQPILSYTAHTDVVNGLSVHPTMPVMCTASGQRHYPSLGDSDDSDADTAASDDSIDNSIRLWWFQQSSEHADTGVS